MNFQGPQNIIQSMNHSNVCKLNIILCESNEKKFHDISHQNLNDTDAILAILA